MRNESYILLVFFCKCIYLITKRTNLRKKALLVIYLPSCLFKFICCYLQYVCKTKQYWEFKPTCLENMNVYLCVDKKIVMSIVVIYRKRQYLWDIASDSAQSSEWSPCEGPQGWACEWFICSFHHHWITEHDNNWASTPIILTVETYNIRI